MLVRFDYVMYHWKITGNSIYLLEDNHKKWRILQDDIQPLDGRIVQCAIRLKTLLSYI